MQRIKWLLCALFWGIAMIHAAQNISEYTLDNGLKVYLIQDPSATYTTARTYVRAGSINESLFYGAGASHYLEHLLAGGSTSKRSEDQYKALISMFGGAFNAYTTADHTSYFINALPQDTSEAIAVLSEWMFHASFLEKEFNREREVITKEIEKTDASIHRKFYQYAQENFYKYSPHRYPVIGYLENFNRLSLEQLKAYYKTNYVPSNMALIVGGNIDIPSTLAQIKKTFGVIPDQAAPQTAYTIEPLPFSKRVMEYQGESHVSYLSLRFPNVDIYSDDLYAMDLLDFILSNGEDSLLNKRLVEKSKLAYSAHCSSYTPSTTSGFFDISFETDYPNIAKLEKETLKMLEEIKQGKLDSKLIERAKKQKLAEEVLSISTIEDKAEKLGQAYIYGYSKDFNDHYVARFKNISKAQLVAAAKKYFNPEKMVVTVLRPKEEVAISTTASAHTSVLVKKPKMVLLQNGVRVLLYHDDSLPKVYAKVFVMGGIRSENEHNNGIGTILSYMLGKGSERFSKAQIYDQVEGSGAQMGATMGTHTLYYGLEAMSEDFPKLTPLFIDTFLHPTFAKSDFEEAKRRLQNRISQRRDDWYSFGSYQFKKAFFGEHPYGLSAMGEKKSLKAIQLKDVDLYFKQLLNPKNMVICIFGDFDEDSILKQIQESFNGLQVPEKAFDAFASLPRKLHTQALDQTLPLDQDVAALFIGFDGVSFADEEDSLKLDLVDAVLSGAHYPSGRLHNLLREKGLVYQVHGNSVSGLEKGYVAICALTSADKIEEVKGLIAAQIKDIQDNPITDEEFKQAIAQLNFYNKDRMASIESLSVICATDELYKNGYDYFTKFDNQVRLLTKKDVQDTAKKYLKNPQIFSCIGHPK